MAHLPTTPVRILNYLCPLRILSRTSSRLRVEEAAEMLAVDLNSDPPGFDEGNRMARPEDILKICGSLVRMDKNPKGRNSLGERDEVQTLTAAHSSVVDFLKENRVRIGQEREFSYTKAAVNLEMAETCLVYLLEFAEGKVMLHEESILNYPLARFSAELWDDFYREVVASSVESKVDMTRVNALIMRLFASRETMLKWIQLCDPDDDTYQVEFTFPISDVKPALYYAALLGLPEIVTHLIRDGHSIDEMADEDCGTPLTAACVYGREKVVSILLDNGADPNLLGDWANGCPLAVAIEKKHKDIAKMLLKTGRIDVNARRLPVDSELRDQSCSTDESVLYIAAMSDSLEMVNALLGAGADPNIQGGPECTALQVACCAGSADIVKALLKYGANVNICGGNSGSPLQAACAYPGLQAVKILVEASVDVNYVGKKLSVSNVLDASDFFDQEMGILLRYISRPLREIWQWCDYSSSMEPTRTSMADIMIIRCKLPQKTAMLRWCRFCLIPALMSIAKEESLALL